MDSHGGAARTVRPGFFTYVTKPVGGLLGDVGLVTATDHGPPSGQKGVTRTDVDPSGRR
jgi:hypothetical protein